MFTRRRLNTLAALSLLAISAPTLALDAPKGRPILSVTGKIGVKNTATGAAFDMAMLEALPQHTFTTRTPWYEKPVTFTGPRLGDLLALVKAQGSTLEATAINDYTVRIPASDATQHPVIVARLLDGKPMRVRDKGPLFVVYPFDSSHTLRTSVYYERSIWQLKAINVLP